MHKTGTMRIGKFLEYLDKNLADFKIASVGNLYKSGGITNGVYSASLYGIFKKNDGECLPLSMEESNEISKRIQKVRSRDIDVPFKEKDEKFLQEINNL